MRRPSVFAFDESSSAARVKSRADVPKRSAVTRFWKFIAVLCALILFLSASVLQFLLLSSTIFYGSQKRLEEEVAPVPVLPRYSQCIARHSTEECDPFGAVIKKRSEKRTSLPYRVDEKDETGCSNVMNRRGDPVRDPGIESGFCECDLSSWSDMNTVKGVQHQSRYSGAARLGLSKCGHEPVVCSDICSLQPQDQCFGFVVMDRCLSTSDRVQEKSKMDRLIFQLSGLFSQITAHRTFGDPFCKDSVKLPSTNVVGNHKTMPSVIDAKHGASAAANPKLLPRGNTGLHIMPLTQNNDELDGLRWCWAWQPLQQENGWCHAPIPDDKAGYCECGIPLASHPLPAGLKGDDIGFGGLERVAIECGRKPISQQKYKNFSASQQQEKRTVLTCSEVCRDRIAWPIRTRVGLWDSVSALSAARITTDGFSGADHFHFRGSAQRSGNKNHFSISVDDQTVNRSIPLDQEPPCIAAHMVPAWERLLHYYDRSYGKVSSKVHDSNIRSETFEIDAGPLALVRGRQRAAKMNVVVMGLIRGVGWDGIMSMLERLRHTVSGFRDHRILLFENDSRDRVNRHQSKSGLPFKQWLHNGKDYRGGEGTRGALQRSCLEDTKLHCQLATYRVPRWDSSMKNDRLVAMAHHRLVMQSN